MLERSCTALLLAAVAAATNAGAARAADQAASYQVVFGPLPRYTLDLYATGGAVTFTLRGAGMAIAGAGPLSGNAVTLSAPVGDGATLTMTLALAVDWQSFTGSWRLAGGPRAEGSIVGSTAPWPVHDVDTLGVPRLLVADAIELGKIGRVSRFRSGEGHDYSDDFESCRSMKHYYDPLPGVERRSVVLFAPVTGAVIGTADEWDGALWKGTAINVQPDGQPAFHVTLYHVDAHPRLAVGDRVVAGQVLGTSAKISGTVTDLVVGVHTRGGYRLVSAFDAMSDGVFTRYAARGVADRQRLVIPREERDANPLVCTGETFLDPGTLENWVALSPPPPPRPLRRRLPTVPPLPALPSGPGSPPSRP